MAKIIVVDDSMFMRKLIKDIVEKNGHNVIGEASDGRKAIELYKNMNPDIVIIDITMHDIDGLEAMEKIMEYDSNAKVIICSALDQREIVSRAVMAGAKEFIVKPFNENRILTAIEQVIKMYS